MVLVIVEYMCVLSVSDVHGQLSLIIRDWL